MFSPPDSSIDFAKPLSDEFSFFSGVPWSAGVLPGADTRPARCCAVLLVLKMMEPDTVSIKSSDSVTTSGEYEIVPEGMLSPLGARSPEAASSAGQIASSPTLNIANNGDMQDLEKNLTEVIHELEDSKKPDDRAEGTEGKQTFFCHKSLD